VVGGVVVDDDVAHTLGEGGQVRVALTGDWRVAEAGAGGRAPGRCGRFGGRGGLEAGDGQAGDGGAASGRGRDATDAVETVLRVVPEADDADSAAELVEVPGDHDVVAEVRHGSA
jgi:hypothetical protein